MKTLVKNLSFIVISFVCFSLAIETKAQQTKKISLQGFLKDANGKAVADGAQDMIFKLYTQDAGGTAEWTENQTVNVFGGVYSTHLGKTEPLDNLNWGAKTYYVGVTVQGTELTPRTELTFAPYSLGSPKAQEVVCSGAVGDVKYSILNPTQFRQVNGDCWVPMDGGSMVGSKLAAIIGGSNVPNAGGLFLRGQESQNGSTDNDPDRTAASTIATLQNQDFLSHAHTGSTSSAGNHSHTYYDWYANTADKGYAGSTDYSMKKVESTGEGAETTSNAGDHNHSLNINANGGNETRPKNLNLWTYIRIN